MARVERLRNFFRENPVAAAGQAPEAFKAALADDFNTPRALAVIFDLVGAANRGEVDASTAAGEIAAMLDLVGLGTLTQPEEGAGADPEAQKLMEEREEARAGKDFDRADALRDELVELGWEVRDSAEGPSLVPKT